MRKARFTEEQMVAIMREADRDPVSAVDKRHGISGETIYTWASPACPGPALRDASSRYTTAALSRQAIGRWRHSWCKFS